ncbi:hypothetical protein M758_UG247300 [Ceratodon purpureus]|nr:hypothetical protein M758_UG247300 [Ceratodon purpureus]
MNAQELDRAIQPLSPGDLLKLSILSAVVFVSRLLRTWCRRIDRALSQRLGSQLQGSGGVRERRNGEGLRRSRGFGAACGRIVPEVKEEAVRVPDTHRLRSASAAAVRLSGKSCVLVPESICFESCEKMARTDSVEICRESLRCILCPGVCVCPSYYAALSVGDRAKRR